MQFLLATVATVWLLLLFISHAMMKSDTKIAAGPNKPASASRKKKKSADGKKEATPSPQKSNSGNAITNLCRRMAGSNWESAPEAKPQAPAVVSSTESNENQPPATKKKKEKHRKAEKWTKFVAMDCEMVGTGTDGRDDMLARVSIVNQNGDVLLDKYVKPQEPVVDYRTQVSGIRPQDMENGEEFEKVQEEVKNLLRERVLVGHSIKNDLGVLNLKHPQRHIRDTAKYRPLAKLVSNGATPSLKRLAKAILGMDIQGGEHSSVEDARAVMLVYVRFSAEWERYLQKLWDRRQSHGRRRS